MLPVEFYGNVSFLPVLLRGFHPNAYCGCFDGSFQTIKAVEREVVPIGRIIPVGSSTHSVPALSGAGLAPACPHFLHCRPQTIYIPFCPSVLNACGRGIPKPVERKVRNQSCR